MRTLTAAQQAVFSSQQLGARWRVHVKDSGGTWRDLTSYPGFNACIGATVKEDVDGDVATATIELKRSQDDLSLAGLVTTSPLNLGFAYPGSYAPLISSGRELKIDVAYIGADQPVESSDWLTLFHGKIDDVDDGNDPIVVECRDLGGDLQDTQIETERVYGVGPTTAGVRVFKPSETYVLDEFVVPAGGSNGRYYKVTTAGTTAATEPTWPTGSGSTVTSGTCTFTEQGAISTAGMPMQSMMQAVLTDNPDAGSVTLYTPVSPAWNVKHWLESRGPVLKPLKMLAEQRGWVARYKWDNGTSTHRFTLYGPDRTKTVPDQTFAPGRVLKVTQAKRSRTRVRNRIRVVYSDSADRFPDGTPKRKSYTAEDLASQAAYGVRFMEVAEEESSHIDTAAEAQAFADAMLSDLAEPQLGLGVRLQLYPFAELGDLYRFSGDGKRFTNNQDLAVVGITHTLRALTARTDLVCSGKPSAGVMRHLSKQTHPAKRKPHDLQVFNAATAIVTTSEVVGGTRLQVSANLDKWTKWEGIEVHISTTSGFTPSSSTLKFRGRSLDAVINDIAPGVTYYVRTVPYGWNSSRLVRGEPTPQQSFVAGHAHPQHINPDANMLPMPPNGDFAGMQRGTSSPPDRWTVETGSWASGGGDIYFRTDDAVRSGLRAIEFGTRLEASTLLSDYLPVLPGHVYAVEMWANPSNVAQTPKLEVVWYSAKGTVISTSTLSRTPSATGYYLTTYNVVSPSTAKWAQVRIGKTSASADTVTVDDVRLRPIGDKWHEVGAAGEPAFLNAWVNYDVATYHAAAFFRDAHGFVHLRGLVRNGTVGAAIFTLPVGYRPSRTLHFGIASNGAFGWIRIDTAATGTAGNVVLGGGSNAWVDLAGVPSFMVDV